MNLHIFKTKKKFAICTTGTSCISPFTHYHCHSIAFIRQISLLCNIHLIFFFLQGVSELGMNIGHAPEVMGFMANMPHAPSVAPINMRIGFAPAVAGFQVANAGQKL